MKAMILAAGLGSRLKPWTDKHPKALAVVNGKSLLQRNIEYLHGFGIHQVIVNVHHFADQVIRAIEENNGWGSEITISVESDAVLETGGGLKKAGWFFDDGDFVLMNADVLTDLNLYAMMESHRAQNPLATLATRNRDTSRYFLFDNEETLCGWRNVKTGEEILSRSVTPLHQLAFSGMHIISPDIFALIKKEGKFSMVDLYLNIASGHIIKSYQDNSSSFIDVGKPESIEKASVLFK